VSCANLLVFTTNATVGVDDVNQHDFRGLEKMEYAEEFQRNAKGETIMKTFAPDLTVGPTKPHRFRDEAKMEYADDFQRAGRNESAIVAMQSERLGEYDESAHEFRDNGKMPYVEDFQRTGVNETSIVSLGKLNADGGEKHAHAHAHKFRDDGNLEYADDFQRTSVNETAMVGLEPARLGKHMLLSCTLLVPLIPSL
jgi:hypothetical protein